MMKLVEVGWWEEKKRLIIVEREKLIKITIVFFLFFKEYSLMYVPVMMWI